MYRPPAFTFDDTDAVLDTLRRVAFGHLVSVGRDGEPEATALPFLVDDPGGDDVGGRPLVVRAHLARANAQWRSIGDGGPALLIVPTVDAYVSPRWYPTKADDARVVPTWNYELIHLRGTARVRDEVEWKLALVTDLTDHNEAAVTAADGRARWAVSDAPDDFVARQLRAIVGVELTVDALEAKRKLSQNRGEADHDGVVSGLAISPGERARATAALMADRPTPS